MAARDPLVVFTPSGKRGNFPVGTPLLQAARSLGVDIDSVCGGRGLCGRCQVLVAEGEFAKHGVSSSSASLSPFSEPEKRYSRRVPMAEGRRLSCSARVEGDVVIDVPASSQVHRQVVRKDADAHVIELDPVVRLHYVQVKQPDITKTDKGDLNGGGLLQVSSITLSTDSDFTGVTLHWNAGATPPTCATGTVISSAEALGAMHAALDITRGYLMTLAEELVEATVNTYATADTDPEEWDLDQLWSSLKQLYPVGVTIEDLEEEAGGDREHLDSEFLTARLIEDAHAAYEHREQELGTEAMRELERQVLLAVIDRKWREHLYEMDYLREGIGLRAMAQRDPLVEYQREGFDMFTAMMDGIKEESVGYLFNLEVQVEQQVEEVPVADSVEQLEDAPPSLVKDSRPEIRAKGLDAPKRADRLHFSAPSVDGEGGVVEGDFEGAALEDGSDDADGDGGAGATSTRAERRRAAKGGRRRRK